MMTASKGYKNVLKRYMTEGMHLYAIVDSAIYKTFHDLMDIEGEEHIRILLKEPYLYGYESVAPYLVLLDIDDAMTDELLHAATGEQWLTLIVSHKSLDALAYELRDMIVVESEAHGKAIIYRFYDPRNLSNYIHIHSDEELEAFYEDIGGALLTIDAKNPEFMHLYSKEGILVIDTREES